MLYGSADDPVRKHIVLTPNGEYVQHMLKLCEHCVQSKKTVLLMARNQMLLPNTMEKPRSLVLMNRWWSIALKDIQSAPRNMIEVYNCLPRPELIIFDLHSIVHQMTSRPVRQQWSRETLVRHIAKCSAAFCNYLDMQRERDSQSFLDAIVVMPTDTHPLTPAQFKLLIGIYFNDNELYTSFGALSERIHLLQELE